MGFLEKLTLILKGVGTFKLGPAFAIGWNALEYVVGQKSLRSFSVSLALTGALAEADWLSFLVERFELEQSPPAEVFELAECVASEAVNQRVEAWFEGYAVKTQPSGLYTARACVVDVAGNQPHFESSWIIRHPYEVAPPAIAPSSTFFYFEPSHPARFARAIERAVGRSLSTRSVQGSLPIRKI